MNEQQVEEHLIEALESIKGSLEGIWVCLVVISACALVSTLVILFTY